MPSSTRKITLPPTPPKLIVPRSEARQKLEVHVEKGRGIVNRTINSQEEMDQTKADGEKWRDYAIRLLPTLFDTMSVADDFENKTRAIPIGSGDIPYSKESEIFKKWMGYRVRELESVLESLELYSESPTIATHQNATQDTKDALKDPQADALKKIELIANRFHTVARQLSQRHRDHNVPRDTIMVPGNWTGK